ncbi:MAG: hypothetical protein RLZZ316_1582 [Bacteroidota bacterium]|jgi:hypothetical protein
MHPAAKFTAAALLVISVVALAYKKPAQKKLQQPAPGTVTAPVTTPATTQLVVNKTPAKKIQVAVLLDVSNSMDGLIEQAKLQLWNMVSVLGKAQCNGVNPTVEIALYEYGRTTNNEKQGYVKQINSFTGDLNSVSENLFKLTTDGGDEYCGQVIYTSLNDLKWDGDTSNYKVIFIAGNEDFLQGHLSFTKACTLAKGKGVIVNTIYCGDKMQGIQEHWNLGGECGGGSYTNINSNAKLEDIATPYDDQLFTLNDQLNKTYIGYGTRGESEYLKQESLDQLNTKANKSAGLKRAYVKSKSNLYDNRNWDLVDAYKADSTVVNKIAASSLPDSLRSKSKKELLQIVNSKKTERTALQQQIETVNKKREVFIIEERKKKSNANAEANLETAIEQIIKHQARRFQLTIE